MSFGWLAGRRLAPADLTAEGNAFTALRWLLASSVMVSHAWDLTLGLEMRDPTVPIFGIPVAGLAVFLFFSLSGFLVSGSLAKRGIVEFGVARALRLIPGLWVMLIVITLGLGLVFGTLPFGTYLADPQTWSFVARNASLLTASYHLPGVFETLPFPAINGSLWTIPQEVRCYIALGIIGAIGALRSRRWLMALLIVAIIVHVAVPLDAVPLLNRPRRLAISFFLGVVAWQWRAEIRWSWPLALAGCGVALAMVHLPVPRAVMLVTQQITFAYLVGVAAFLAPAAVKRFSARVPDYSYGIYIYAFPVQQAAIALGWGTTPLANLAVSFALVLPLAAASWHLVEHPALLLKSKLTFATGPKPSENFTQANMETSSDLTKPAP